MQKERTCVETCTIIRRTSMATRKLLALTVLSLAHVTATLTRAPEAVLSSIRIGTSDVQQQTLPLSYVSSWPTWVSTPEGDSVTLLPAEDDPGGWVSAPSYEMLWMPQDLPEPTACAAIGVVLKNGVPRYIFPCVETTVTVGNRVYHNRGLHSIPLAKTWMVFGDVPVSDLRLSCYRSPLPPDTSDTEAEGEDEDTTAKAAEGDSAAETDADDAVDWTAVLPLTEVGAAVDAMTRILGDAPDEMGDGFQYLIVPIASAAIPPDAVAAGQRMRLFLSDVVAAPTSTDPEEGKAWLSSREELQWVHGECDFGTYEVAPGGDSDFLPDAYKPLYGR